MDKHNIGFTEFGPHSVVRVLPVHDNSITVELPFLFIRGHDETIQLSAEALSWARSRLLDANLSTIERGIRTLANFNDYCVSRANATLGAVTELCGVPERSATGRWRGDSWRWSSGQRKDV